MRTSRHRRALLGAACAVLTAGAAAALFLAFSADSRAEPTEEQYFARVAAVCRVAQGESGGLDAVAAGRVDDGERAALGRHDRAHALEELVLGGADGRHGANGYRFGGHAGKRLGIAGGALLIR